MRKAQKKQVEELLREISEGHKEIKEGINHNTRQIVMDILMLCQQKAIELGNMIEASEGEGFITVLRLEEYCEIVFQAYEEVSKNPDTNPNKLYKLLNKSIIKTENSVRNDIRYRSEAVFLPYKAAMWDSLESVWKAADADPDCDAYVIPIPYYDRNSDGSFKEMHYEGASYPDYVPIIKYEEFDFEAHRPDMIFIHNPYDNYNFVTSVHPFFYSENLKKFTDCLVYIPYYSIAGGMSEGQAFCPAYTHADYIVIQSESYRKFFDPDIPDEKFLPLGSPKFDRVIHKCQNPPKPPEGWQEKMAGKKVYFYNTSINGMLGNTEAFLKKMEYVFDTFRGREDACLLWRPHPLLESTFDSMRKIYKPAYDNLKRQFIEEELGILDLTPDIEDTIALCDAYIGDSGTSVTSLFGVAGKPVFILNNNIHTLPEKDDWRGERITCPYIDFWGKARYQVTKNNQLWFSEKDDFSYKFYMDLGNGYSGGNYYASAVEIGNRIYIIPHNVPHLLIIENKKIRKIEFTSQMGGETSFSGCWYNERYLFLLPLHYPRVIRFDMRTEKISYISGIQQFWIRDVGGVCQRGGIACYGNDLVFASPEDSQLLFVDVDTLEAKVISSDSDSNLGIQGIVPDGEDLWLLPLNGMVITCWNPKTGYVREYSDLPLEFKSVKLPQGNECNERPFGNIVISRESGRENIVVSPCWGNMYLSLDKETGKMEKWELPMPVAKACKNEYFMTYSKGGFMIPLLRRGKPECQIWYEPERRFFDINIDTKEYKEVYIEFDHDDLKKHEPGFMEESERSQYWLMENAFNSLKDLLDGDITGNQFDRKKQMAAFAKINANTDGTCGRNVYEFVKGNI
jgi:hypothetical protein